MGAGRSKRKQRHGRRRDRKGVTPEELIQTSNDGATGSTGAFRSIAARGAHHPHGGVEEARQGLERTDPDL